MLHQSVTLSFGGGGSKGAWDDRELINAYDAAMDEFHAHHPGPGSWLDKAMAAQSAGLPLAGSSHHDTAWYAATAEQLAQETEAVEPPAKKARNTPRPEITNPYAATAPPAARQVSRDVPRSPQYNPPSPPNIVARAVTPTPPVETAPQALPTTQLAPAPAPLAVHPTHSVTAQDALSYAMTSQYWAGYWMGVSQAMRNPNPDNAPAAEATTPEPNVIRTAHQFAPRKQLKR